MESSRILTRKSMLKWSGYANSAIFVKPIDDKLFFKCDIHLYLDLGFMNEIEERGNDGKMKFKYVSISFPVSFIFPPRIQDVNKAFLTGLVSIAMTIL